MYRLTYVGNFSKVLHRADELLPKFFWRALLTSFIAEIVEKKIINLPKSMTWVTMKKWSYFDKKSSAALTRAYQTSKNTERTHCLRSFTWKPIRWILSLKMPTLENMFCFEVSFFTAKTKFGRNNVYQVTLDLNLYV